MSVVRTNVTTRIRTWLLIAGRYWCSDKLAHRLRVTDAELRASGAALRVAA